jgi:hypothetical protein
MFAVGLAALTVMFKFSTIKAEKPLALINSKNKNESIFFFI